MRNIPFYILLICALTNINAKIEKRVSYKKRTPKFTGDDLEEEARKDIENLLNDSEQNINEYDELLTRTSNTRDQYENNDVIIERIDNLIKQLTIKRRDAKRNAGTIVRNNHKFDDEFGWGDNLPSFKSRFQKLMNNLARNHRYAVKNRAAQFNKLKNTQYHPNNRLKQLMRSLDLSHRDYIRGRLLAGGLHAFLHTDDKALRKLVKELGTDPRIYPGVIKTRNKHVGIMRTSVDDVNFGDLLNDKHDLHHLVKKLDLKPKIIKKKLIERDTLRTLLEASLLNETEPLADRSYRHEGYGVKKGRHGRRYRRSYTQAGYTQDPDTCKIYNENLVKLWSNLSKYINITEQPNERALHNIAIMIQAYLEHQNTKTSTEPYKAKHEVRDKIGEVILRIRKMLDETDVTAEKITKVITKNLKPFYGEAENAECQQVNEESLGSSIDLLYKNYLENSECRNEEDGQDLNLRKRSSNLNLRKRSSNTNLRKRAENLNLRIHPNRLTVKQRSGKKIKSAKWQSSDSEDKPEIKSILSEDELYEDFHKGKMPRERQTTQYRRVFKKSRQYKPPVRSGDESTNDSEKTKIRSKLHKPSRKLRKSLHTTDINKMKCEKYAIRKLTVSLRPVIERFMTLLECQLDNTLRSVNYDRVSLNPYYLYTSNFNFNDNGFHQEPVLLHTKLTRKNTGRITNNSHRKSQTNYRYDTSNEDYRNLFERNDEYLVKKVSSEKLTENNPTSSFLSNLQDFRETETNSNNDDFTNYNEYLQSPPLYDDYDGIYKIHTDNSNGFLSLMNPIDGNDEKKVEKPKNSKNSLSSVNEKVEENLREDSMNTFYEEDMPEETGFASIPEQQLNTEEDKDSKKTLILEDLTTNTRTTDLKTDDNLEKRQESEKTITQEGITDFLKKARDASLLTPEFAVPFALDSNKGYVELTHLVKYPKIIVYRPQFIVKNTIPYDDFLKTINNINMTNDETRLMKIVRHLPDSTVKVLFETKDFEAPLEVRNIKDNRRNGFPVDNPSENVDIETQQSDKYDNGDFNDDRVEDTYIFNYNDRPDDEDEQKPLDKSTSEETDLHSALNLMWNTNSTSDTAFNSPLKLKKRLGLLPDLASGLLTHFGSNLGSSLVPNLSSGLVPSKSSDLVPSKTSGLVPSLNSGLIPSISSVVSPKSGMHSALSLGSNLLPKPTYATKIQSYLNKFLSSQSNTQSKASTSSTLNSHSIENSNVSASASTSSSSNTTSSASSSHSTSNSEKIFKSNYHIPSHANTHQTTNSESSSSNNENTFSENENLSSSTLSSVSQWWRKWRTIIKERIQKIIGNMASLAENVDQIVKL